MTKILKLNPDLPKNRRLLGKNNQSNRAGIYVSSSWVLIQSILWEKQDFTSDEIYSFKEHLRQYYFLAPNQRKAFLALCQRVLITKQYLNRCPNRYLPYPDLWLNRHYKHGFTGTLSWYNKIQAKRKEIPEYYQDYQLFANLYLEFVKAPSARKFRKAKRLLQKRQQHNLFQFLSNCFINYIYSN